jgi:hypothetical protein
MQITTSLLAITLAAACAPAFAQTQTLTLKTASGQALNTIPLVDGTPLAIGDMNAATQLRLSLQGPQGQVAHTVALATGQPINVLSDGNLEAVCATSGAPDTCDGLPPSQAASLQAFTVSAPVPQGGTRPRIAVGSLFRIEWASSSADLCVANGPAQLANWSGTTQRTASGVVANARFTSMPAQTPASLSLRCYGAAGASSMRTILIDVL